MFASRTLPEQMSSDIQKAEMRGTWGGGGATPQISTFLRFHYLGPSENQATIWICRLIRSVCLLFHTQVEETNIWFPLATEAQGQEQAQAQEKKNISIGSRGNR